MSRTIAFLLSMPGNNSWNGRWSGEGRCYAIIRRFTDKKADQLLAKPYHSYDFGDGWRAGIQIKAVDGTESRRIRKASTGFCGYDWMVTSIVSDGAIYGPTQPKPTPEVVAVSQETGEAGSTHPTSGSLSEKYAVTPAQAHADAERGGHGADEWL